MSDKRVEWSSAYLWGWEKGVEAERERIIANIMERVSDLNSCHKDDDCREWGMRIESYIPEWTDPYRLGENK